jgi:hypothetical protein
MPLQVLLSWWNLIFILPFGLALMYLGLFVFTGITFGDADADADMDADADVDADADMDADADVDGDADVDAHADVNLNADADHDADVHSPDHDAESALAHPAHAHPEMLSPTHSIDTAHTAASPMAAFLSFLGIGKIPVSLALMTLLFCWGLIGFALNTILYGWLGNSAFVGLISIPVTLTLALTLTGLFAKVIAKIIPNDDSLRENRSDLVGKPAEAMFDINATFGMARVRGAAGDFFQVPCRTALGKPPILKGAKIVLFDYDRDQGVFQVAPFES